MTAISYLISQEDEYLNIATNGLNLEMMRRLTDIVTSVDIKMKNFVNEMNERDIRITTIFYLATRQGKLCLSRSGWFYWLLRIY